MASGQLFIISVVFASIFLLNAVYLIKAQRHDINRIYSSNFVKSDFKDEEQKGKVIKVIEQPDDCPRCPTRGTQRSPVHASTTFRFTDVGLRRIGQDFISSSDIISLSLDNNEISNISPFAFRGMDNLHYLNLSGNRIPKEKLLSFAGVGKLHTLIIDSNNDSRKLSTKILTEHEVFNNLKYLYLRNDHLQNLQVPFHAATPFLIHLYLSNNSIGLSDIVFGNIPTTLTELHLDNNLISRVEQDKLSYLHVLNMDNNIITHVCFATCEEQSISLKGAVRMQRLSLSGNKISEVSVDAFSDTQQLTHLDLSNNKIVKIAESTFNRTMHIIDLSLADNMLSGIPDVCSLIYLRSLNLTGNQIGVIHSNSFCFLKKLEYLYLANNLITTIESQVLATLVGLRYLDLSGNQLRQLPVQQIYYGHLQQLHLERNRFGSLDDIALSNIKSLKDVYLDENPMPIFGVQSFHSLPMHLTVHMMNILAEDNCSKCKCEDDDEEKNESGEDNDYNR